MKLRQEYGYLREFWQEDFRIDVRNCAVAFVLSALAGYAAGLLLPAFRDFMLTVFQQVLKSAGIDTAADISMIALLSNNLFATFYVCLYGLIPFVYLPALSLGVNAAILGVMAAIYQVNGISMGLYFAALVPHGIFELPALVLALAVAMRLCREITKLCRKRSARPFSHVIADCCRVFALAVLPLLIAASAVEAYVTPWIMSFFLPI